VKAAKASPFGAEYGEALEVIRRSMESVIGG
jgi:hypothetical protein